MNEKQAKILVDSYTVERYVNEMPNKLLKALAEAPVYDEEMIDWVYNHKKPKGYLRLNGSR